MTRLTSWLREVWSLLPWMALLLLLVVAFGGFAYFVGSVWTSFWIDAPWWAWVIFPTLFALLLAVGLSLTVGQKLLGHLWPSRFGDWRRYDWLGRARPKAVTKTAVVAQVPRDWRKSWPNAQLAGRIVLVDLNRQGERIGIPYEWRPRAGEWRGLRTNVEKAELDAVLETYGRTLNKRGLRRLDDELTRRKVEAAIGGRQHDPPGSRQPLA